MKAIPTLLKTSLRGSGEVEIRYFPSRKTAQQAIKALGYDKAQYKIETEDIDCVDCNIAIALRQFTIQRRNKRLRKKYPKAFGEIL